MEMSKTFQQIKAYAQLKGLPFIPISSKNVSIIDTPNNFYQSILNKVSSSSRRIALSALYIGTGTKESTIIRAICDNKNKNNGLNVHIVLDSHRATRLDSTGQSSETMLEKLLSFEGVKLSLFDKVPKVNILSRILSKYQKWNELTSTFHSKVLVFDNDVLMTGANLSEIYFDRRQDRYITLENTKELSDYLFKLLQLVSQKQKSLKGCLSRLNSEYVKNQDKPINCISSDSYIIPLCQFGLSGITDKEDFLIFLDSIMPSGAKVHLSTGYFNPSSTVEGLRISSILAPSEAANGFYVGKGVLKYIPRLYSALADYYVQKHPICEFSLYNRKDWSYHAKGVWYEGLDDIYIHIIGSSNFNHRSSSRDFETQLVLLTCNKDLIYKLQSERTALWNTSSQVEKGGFEGLNLIYKTFAQLVKTFL